MLTNQVLAQTIINAFVATDPDKNDGLYTNNNEIAAFRNWYYQNFNEVLTIANSSDPKDDPTLTSYHSLAAEIDYSELSEFLDYGTLANEVDEENIMQYVCYSDLADSVDYSELAQYIGHSEIAAEFKVYDIAEYVETNDIADHIDLDELADILINKLKDKLV